MQVFAAIARTCFPALLGGCMLLMPATAAEEAADVATGTRLAEFLRAARSVLSNYQPLINDPSVGDKHLDGERFTTEAIAFYAKRTGHPLITADLSERDRKLIQAQIEAMREVVDEQQADINRPGIGFKGFVPAVFARLMNEKFAAKVGAEALVRVTAPEDLVRNRKSLPDAWESGVIENVFSDADRPKGDSYTEVTTVDDRPAFRMLLPEYYTESCLTCHGAPKGEIDVTGYPKEGGKAGDLGGAISIVLFK
ncbi:c-type heme family protein [Sinorhizobium alkalisoli]|uniref:c-type heme family protein n=1 Tax=Sinorhizobium alkalisoli TaxID=1752398 RepID=UPI00124F728D